jgi:RimJ/RimL family protein N-acetyltransferase
MLPMSDGIVTLRALQPGDSAVLIAGRDGEHRKWLGIGSDDPRPTACIVVDGALARWVDADPDPKWLPAGAVNIGYSLFPTARGNGYATRAVRLLLKYLAETKSATHAVAAIQPDNTRSIAVVCRVGFVEVGRTDLGRMFQHSIADAR